MRIIQVSWRMHQPEAAEIAIVHHPRQSEYLIGVRRDGAPRFEVSKI
jgi:hypothetical protein